MLNSFYPGEIWPDDHGVHINAHGGGVLFEDGVYYWYGEHRIEGTAGNVAHVGVHVYSSQDLMNWMDRGIAFDIRDGKVPECPNGCIVERPKVLRSLTTGKYVMLFHYEADKTYRNAAVGFAVSDTPIGPFVFHHIQRPNPGVWPVNTPEALKDVALIAKTRETMADVSGGMNDKAPTLSILGACLETGQESRDMTLFRDDGGKTYHIYSSERNATTHIAQMTDDLLGYAGNYCRVFENRWMEGQAIFKHNGKYYIVASGCTGWAPNAARSAVADNIFGPWRELGNPAIWSESEVTFRGQTNFALSLPYGRVILMLDRWNPQNAIDGRYLWLPVEFDGERPIIRPPVPWKL